MLGNEEKKMMLKFMRSRYACLEGCVELLQTRDKYIKRNFRIIVIKEKKNQGICFEMVWKCLKDPAKKIKGLLG